MWGKGIQLQTSAAAVKAGRPDGSSSTSQGSGEQQRSTTEKAQPAPCSSAVATVRVGQRGGVMALVMDDQAGNARSIMLAEVELGYAADQGGETSWWR